MTKIWMVALFLAVSPCTWAQAAITPPQLGFVEDSARALRPAYGVAGNFILGPTVAAKIVTEGFSGSVGLMKTDSTLAAFDAHGKLLASRNVAAGPALFAFSPSGTTALAYIASSNELIEWRGSTFVPISLNYDEGQPQQVLAVAFPDAFEASLIVQRKDGVLKLNFPLGAGGNASQSTLSGVQAPLLALPSGDLVYSEKHGVVVRRTDASEVRIAAVLPTSFSLQQMNQDWVQVTDLNGTAHFAIHTRPGREHFYQLPETGK